ncbi:non-ribosomal peptide synthetase [Colletotrichum filicis]|nr:non-ribosomal peptide synthetase [Colletotrichum filicis]
MPLGITGELWLEGPIVGAGYLNEEEKTAAAFVHDPSWLEPILVAYVALLSPGEASLDDILASLVVGELSKELASALLAHLVPTAYIPLKQMLLTMTGKIDRKRLREMGAAMTRD